MFQTIIKKYHFPIGEIAIAKGLISKINGVLTSRDLRVTDAIIHRALEGPIFAEPLLILPDRVKPDMKTVAEVEQALHGYERLVAIGSGTVNDICKLAAFRANKKYISVPTAPSMNGYASGNASIEDGAIKKSFAAAPPQAIYADLDIITHAPRRMVQAGLADLLCRTTVQADWLLAHLLFDSIYREEPFDWIKEQEAYLLNNSLKIAEQNPQAIEILMQGLILSGLGMLLCDGSYPASQGEHALAHYLESKHPKIHQYLHGEHIAVTSIAMSALQHHILETEPELPAKSWQEIAQKLRAVMLPKGQLQDVLLEAGCPIQAEDIGLTKNDMDEALKKAKHVRERYSFLNLI